MALGPTHFLGMNLLQTHALGGQWGQWIPIALNALVQLLQTAPLLPPTSLEHVKQDHIDPMASKAVTALLRDLQARGIIVTTDSSFNSPFWPIQKPNSDWQLTVDYCAVSKASTIPSCRSPIYLEPGFCRRVGCPSLAGGP